MMMQVSTGFSNGESETFYTIKSPICLNLSFQPVPDLATYRFHQPEQAAMGKPLTKQNMVNEILLHPKGVSWATFYETATAYGPQYSLRQESATAGNSCIVCDMQASNNSSSVKL